MIFNKFVETIDKHNMISDGDKIIVALSGGPDSVCLIHLLNRLKESRNLEIYAAHLNHQIRGIEAQMDAMYVSELCNKLNIPVFIKSVDVPAYCEKNGLSLEEGARKVRYEMLYEIKRRTGSNKIAVGHNMNDQAETVIMRIMRGTGLQGLRGIEYVREDGIIRPILDIERKDIEEYCTKNELDPKIDKTNLESIYTRNRIRLELIPYMKEHFNGNVIESIVRLSNSMKSDGDYIDSESMKAYKEVCTIDENSVEINIDKFLELHEAIKNRVIRFSIRDVLGDTNFVDQKHIEEVIQFIRTSKNGKVINLPRGVFVYRKLDTILFTMEEIKEENLEFNYNIPKDGFIKIKELGLLIDSSKISIEKYRSLKKDEMVKAIDFDKVKGGITVRNRKPGDKIKLKGGTKKIKDLFIDLKIPREDRNRVPILVDEDGVILAGEYRVSENYKIDETTKNVLKLSIKKL